jgi:hypothetical protein
MMTKESETMIDGLRFVLTCDAFPEQYDVFDGDVQVGYVRVRHGNFSVSCPDIGDGPYVIDRGVDGYGDFTDEERGHGLTEAAAAIRQWQVRDQ